MAATPTSAWYSRSRLRAKRSCCTVLPINRRSLPGISPADLREQRLAPGAMCTAHRWPRKCSGKPSPELGPRRIPVENSPSLQQLRFALGKRLAQLSAKEFVSSNPAMLSIRHDILQEFRRMSLTDARVTVALARLDRRHLECQRDRRSLAEIT